MKYIIPGYKDLYIDENYNLSGSEIDQVSYPIQNYISLKIQNRQHIVFNIWLFLYAAFETPVEVDFRGIQFYKYIHTKTFLRVRPMWLIPFYLNQEYRVIPMCPNYAANKNGIIIDRFTMKEITQTKSEYYYTVNIYDPYDKKLRTIKVHILVANAWINKDQSELRHFINHKNGNKLDNRVENLEWVTQSENSLHAARNDLTKMNQKCMIRNIETGEIIHFINIQEAAEYLGISEESLYNEKDHRRRNDVFNFKYEFKYEDDESNWNYPIGCKIMNNSASQYQFRIYNKDTKELMIFNGVIPVKKYFKVWKNNGQLDTAQQVKEEVQRRFPNLEITLINRLPQHIVQVLDLNTNNITEYSTVEKAAESLNSTCTCIGRAAKTDGKRIYRHYRIRFKSDKPWPNEVYKPQGPKKIKLTYPDNKELTFDSKTDAAKHLGISLILLRKLINKKLTTHGCLVEEIGPM